MFSKTSLLINVLIAAVAGFFMNVAVYELAPSSLDEEELNGFCVVIYEDGEYPPVQLSDIALEGANIFKANCASCHAVHKKVVGPALKNVVDRWPSRELLMEFIRYPEKTITSGKVPYATALYEEYKAAGFMQNNDYLNDEQLEAILLFIAEESERSPVRALPVAVVSCR